MVEFKEKVITRNTKKIETSALRFGTDSSPTSWTNLGVLIEIIIVPEMIIFTALFFLVSKNNGILEQNLHPSTTRCMTL